MNRYSLRWRLPLSYAAIALLSVLALGLVLIVTLQEYYDRLGQRYLTSNAAEVGQVAAEFLEAGASPELLQDQVQSWSFFMQARVQLLDPSGTLLADSGVPQALQVMLLSNPPEEDLFFKPEPGLGEVVISAGRLVTATLTTQQVYVFSSGGVVAGVQSQTSICPPDATDCGPVMIRIERTQDGQRVPVPMTDTVSIASAAEGPVVGVAMPLESSLYGFNLAQDAGVEMRRSSQVVELPLVGSSGQRLGAIRLSDGPAYGEEIVASVLRGWLVAGAAAVALAVLAGWLISWRITAPLLALNQATTRMAGGDLAARAALQSKDEFGQLAGSFNDMAGRVEEMVSTLRNFISDAAHELHTPLTALRTYLELAGDEPDPARQTAHLAAANAQAARLQGVIDGLLDLYRLEGASPAHILVDLGAIVEAAVDTCASRFDQIGLHLELQLPAEPLRVMGDAAQLRLVLDNLLDNAGKFTPAGGRVQVRLLAVDGLAELHVADTGIGVPAEDLSALFHRFHRGRNVAAYPGSGLGLAVVRSLVAAHAGEISVQKSSLVATQEEPGSVEIPPGTEFVLRFPLQ